MTESIITFPSKIGSNNPKAYGAINATQVSGHKQVATTSDLYTISDSILSESKDNTNNDAIGQRWFVQSSQDYYQLISWENRNNSRGWSVVQGGNGDGGTNIVISDTPPLDTNDIWADDSEKSIPEYVNEDLQSLIQAVNAIQQQIRKYEYAFNNQLSSGDFTNNTADAITSIEPEQPAEYTEEQNLKYIGTNTARDPEYPAYSETMIPNLKHLCIKAGKYTDLLDNQDKFLNNELLWCTDTQRLYIKSEGSLVWINKSGGGGGEDPDPGDEGMTKDDLDKLDYIGFVAPSGQTYRVKVSNDGKLIVYMKELDTPQAEPTGGQTDPSTGWVYVTSLYLQKLYINSLYCGGLTADEHSYNYCSHNFVELSNLTDADINLNGLSLQYSSGGTNWEVLPLEGLIKKGETFLIRGAQCSVMDANTTRIKVNSYDMEWYAKDGQLIKFDNTKAKFYLTWGDTPSSVASPYSNVGGSYKVSKGYIDLVGLNKENAGDADTIDAKENNPYAYLNSNRLFTKYYSMDPVSQATKSLDKRNNANDWYFVDLTKDIIPMIESYTPKATYEHKNIFYNKTKLDTTKPNYITCTFGIQATAPNATRCFNWISTEYHDEFLWYKKQGESEWNKVESFKNESGIRKYYNRIRSEFTDGTAFTTHKVIIKNLSAGVYDYKVVRDENYESEVLHFTVREGSDEFTFVQVSDQQGFRWDEYQIWKSSAEYIKDNVADMEFTVNTGDMTQNGNRVNEWIDYYTGRQAMKDFEEMPVIGNNDLCPANIYQLGNGGDSSKINPKNLSFFYTFEMDEENPPIFNIEGKEVFIDSLYSFNYGNVHFMAINSEITDGTEKNVYGLSTNGLVYSNMKTWCQNDIDKNSDKTWKIAFTHELPFTIITQNVISNFYWDNTENSKIERSGSHLNYNTTADNKYWFSKFCQENDIRLAIGGHKHTYAATFPLKENPASTMKPIIQVTAEMLQESFGTTTLAADNSDPQLEGQLFPSTWIGNDAYKTQKHLCTFELVDRITAPVYITNQATGYKHTSNKELPSPYTPWDHYFFPATITQTSQTDITAKVNAGQRYPFYTIYKVTASNIQCITKKINYLFTSAGKYNVNIPSSSNPPAAIGGNGEINSGNDIIVITK